VGPASGPRGSSLAPCPQHRTGATPFGGRTVRAVDIATLAPVLALSHQSGVTFAEIGFLLIQSAGIWLIASQVPAFKMPAARTIVAGIALALAGVLLIVATHWGHFG